MTTPLQRVNPQDVAPPLGAYSQGVVAPAQGGVHASGRRTYGHSMVVGPWGEILAERPEGEGVVLADIDVQRIHDMKRRLG